MKIQRNFWIGFALLLFMLVVMLLTFPTFASNSSPPMPTHTDSNKHSHSLTEQLVVLQVVLPELDEIPPGLSPEQAAKFARSLVYQQAQPIMAELERLRAQGEIEGYKVRPDLHGVTVVGAMPDALDELARQQAMASVLPVEDEPPACAVASTKALSEQVFGLSRTAARLEQVSNRAPLAEQATDPSINVYYSSGNENNDIMGKTTPNTAVGLRILRNGRVVGSDITTSNSNGYYYFYPSWQDCPIEGYDWTLQSDDVVEVTAHGKTVSTVVVNLSAWVDPESNTVAGITGPNRTVEVWLSQPDNSDPCISDGYSQDTIADGSGSFNVDLSGQVNFDRKASADVAALDANGNSTYYWFDAYHISSRFNTSSFWGYIKPEVDYTATMSRTGAIISTYIGESSSDGYYSGYFSSNIQPGDVIQVTGGGVDIEYTAVGLEVALDHVNDQAIGVTGANRQVKMWFYKRTWGYVYTSCSWDSDCASTTADGTGAFTLDTDLDLVRGDVADLYVYDADGNYQYIYDRTIPAIIADFTWDDVYGYWGYPDVGFVDIILKDSSGIVKDTDTWVDIDSWDGEFKSWYLSNIVPTDIIEVTDGIFTETMTVQNLTTRLDGGSGHLTGQAYNDHLLARLWDFRRGSGWWSYCSETDVTGGAYNLVVSGIQAGAQDEAEVWSTGPDGHYSNRYTFAFTVNAQKDNNDVWGYTETPETSVTVTLKSGVTTKATFNVTSDYDGWFGYWFDGGDPVAIAQGDSLLVQTGDGDSATVPIPELTTNANAANNLIYGDSPASKPVLVGVRRNYIWGWHAYYQYTTADSLGNYSADFNGQYWWRDCSAVDVGHHCAQLEVEYYNDEGHGIFLEGLEPPDAGPDVYEDDNVYTTASAYAGKQSHTFHDETDIDWTSFTVPGEDVANAVVYQIETLNLGWEVDTVLNLYDTDGTTELEENDDWDDLESRINWIPPAAGTYYVLIEPYDEDSTENCDAVYALMIFPIRAQVYLPLVSRGY
ncbi:MAG: hypothetical protein JXA42_10825 [Anaerolineales bacterium]|nr:hypothetical protein [Anaerolineales bacterium]